MTDQRETKEDGELHFYYNREERLKKAGLLAQYTNSLYTRKKPGLFSSMTATGPLRFLFFSIIVLALLIFGYQIYQNFEKSIAIDGVRYSAKVMRFEHDLYITVRRETANAADLEKQVQVTVAYEGLRAEASFVPSEVETGIKLTDIPKSEKGTVSIEIIQNTKKAEFTIKLH